MADKVRERVAEFKQALINMGVERVEMNGIEVDVSQPSARVNLNEDEFSRLAAEAEAALTERNDLRRKQRLDVLYEKLVEHGSADSEAGDDHRWRLAFYASLVQKSYGDDALGQYATDINDSATRLGELRRVFLYFSREFIDHYRAKYPILRYTHFRLARTIGQKKEDFKQAEDFLIQCGENDWRVTKAEYEADQLLGKSPGGAEKITEGSAEVVGVDGDLVTIRVANEEIKQVFIDRQASGARLLLKLYEPEF